MGNNKGNCKPSQLPRQANIHNINYLVHINDVIDFFIMHYRANKVEIDDRNKYSDNDGDNVLLVVMAG
jgi:hypothetical protein